MYQYWKQGIKVQTASCVMYSTFKTEFWKQVGTQIGQVHVIKIIKTSVQIL